MTTIPDIVQRLRNFIENDQTCQNIKQNIQRSERDYKAMSDKYGLSGILGDEELVKRWYALKADTEKYREDLKAHVRSFDGVNILEESSKTLFDKLIFDDDKVFQDINDAVQMAMNYNSGQISEKVAVNHGTSFMSNKYNLPNNFFKKM